MRAITLDGDVFEPGATITGGSRPSSSDLLLRLHELSKISDTLQALNAQWNDLMRQERELNALADQYRGKTSEVKSIEHELNSLETIMRSSSSGQVFYKRCF